METDSMKLLLLCLTIITLIFHIVGFRDGNWHKKNIPTKTCDIFWFIVNILFYIGLLIDHYFPPQPMLYMIACFAEGFYVIGGVAIVCFLLVDIGPSAIATRIAAETTIVDGVLCLLDLFVTGLIAYFSFHVWKLGG
uniref:MARVEL domain-containing protein n=1 Tax=Panagrolaimus davidi TaxID=227884 RepID=A0A914PCW0_9BILA